jgi:translation initiation factor 2D
MSFTTSSDVAISSRSLLRTKEGKALRDAVLRCMPSLDTTRLDILIHPKGIEVSKFTSSAKLIGYGGVGAPPDIIDLDPKSHQTRLLPTLTALWRVGGDFFPTLLIPSVVSPFLLRGADLMLPGVIAQSLPFFRAGDMVAISVLGNPSPIAIGEAIVSSDAAVASEMRGRGVRILHFFGDALWVATGRVVPNIGFARGDTVEALVSTVCTATNIATTNTAATTATTTSNADVNIPVSISSTPIISPDEILRSTLLQALSHRRHTNSFPYLPATFLGKVLAGARLASSPPLDVRATSFKKFSVFLNSVCKEGLITLGTEGQIISFDAAHPALRAHRGWPAYAEAAATSSVTASGGGGGGGG